MATTTDLHRTDEQAADSELDNLLAKLDRISDTEPSGPPDPEDSDPPPTLRTGERP